MPEALRQLFNCDDESFMRRALELACRAKGRTTPNPAVGAVIVFDGVVVGEGYHPAAGEPHAEIFALRQAGEKARGATIYVTLEPCCHQGRTGPCSRALITSGVRRVVVGTGDPNPKVSGDGIAQLREAGIVVDYGCLESECLRLIAPFAKHVTTGLPYVTLKAGMTLDGAVATVTGDSQWITATESRLAAHRLRGEHDAIMVGVGTVLTDNPRLTTRLPEGGGKNPLRIVLDSHLRTPSAAAMLKEEGQTLIFTTAAANQEDVEHLSQERVEVLRLPETDGRVNLHEVLNLLGSRGIQSLLLEGGGTMHHSALHAGVVDRICLFVAPTLLGGSGIPLFSGAGVGHLKDAFHLKNLQVERYGDDFLFDGEL